MLEYHQSLDPLGNVWLSTLLAALPVIVLFTLLVPARLLAPWAGLGGAVTALAVATLAYGMPSDMAGMAFVHGMLFGFLPVGWTIVNAMLTYNITVETGQFTVIKRSVAGLSGDARIQALLLGFSFGAFLEGAAGSGTPVAICGAIMVGLGFDPFLAAVLCLIANTSPVAYGGLGTPLIVLNGVTDLPTETLSVMAGHQLPILSLIIPLWMIKTMCTWRQTFAIWPALLVSGGSFAVLQYSFATMHTWIPGVVLYPMTDICGGIFSLVITALFLKVWKPKREWHFDGQKSEVRSKQRTEDREQKSGDRGQDACEAEALLEGIQEAKSADAPLTAWSVAKAWTPFALMSVALFLTGLVRQKEVPVKEGPGPVTVGSISTNYQIAIPRLHQATWRDNKLHDPNRGAMKPESALFNLAWLSSPGTAVFLSSIASMLFLRMRPAQIARVLSRTAVQMKIPIPTIALMLGLSYVTRYSGMDATLGYAFAGAGLAYPFFAAILGWLGVFLTGTDAGSNALFGSLQKITATEIFNSGAFTHLTLGQAQTLICTANSTGGVMGKMIDAQSICVATAGTHQVGGEADIFKAVLWHSVVLASLVGVIVLLQAYVWPFTLLVPHP